MKLIWMILDKGANKMGFLFSNLLIDKIGKSFGEISNGFGMRVRCKISGDVLKQFGGGPPPDGDFRAAEDGGSGWRI